VRTIGSMMVNVVASCVGGSTVVRAPTGVSCRMAGSSWPSSASSISARVTSTTVSHALNWPDELTAVASAAADVLSGSSAIT